MRALLSLLLIVPLALRAICVTPDPPPVASTSTSYSPSVALSIDQRSEEYIAAYRQAELESDILAAEEEEEEEEEGWTAHGLGLSEKDTEEEEEEFQEGQFEGEELAPPPLESEEPDSFERPSTSATVRYPILGDPRGALEAALKEQHSAERARQLANALTRIRTRQGWPDNAQVERSIARIEAWQDLMLSELEAAGTLPTFARLFTQPARRYLAPVLSQYAWPPLYALFRNGEYETEHRFGEGRTLSERIVERMGELNSESIIGNLDVSYIAFPGSCTGKHPVSKYLSIKQRSAVERFHFRVYREILQYPRIIFMNGGDVELDLVQPLVGEEVFEIEEVNLPCRITSLRAYLRLSFIRLPGASLEDSSLLIRRRHPQALAASCKPSLVTQLRADAASELLRDLAAGGERLPANEAFLATFDRQDSVFVPPGSTDEPLEPTRVPIEFRLAHLARVERGRAQPWTMRQLRIIDDAVAEWVRVVVNWVPERTTDLLPCASHIVGSPLQMARNRLLALASETRHRTYSIRSKIRWEVTLTPEEEEHHAKANLRKAKRESEAVLHPERHERWKEARRDHKRDRTEAERIRALQQDQASYQRRREEMTPEERAGRLEQQSQRSNVRNLVVVSPLDFLTSLNCPPQPLDPSNAASPPSVGSNFLVPAVGSTSNSVPSPFFPIFHSGSGIGLPGSSNVTTSNSPSSLKRPLSKGPSSKSTKKKSSKQKKSEEEEEEVITTAVPQSTRSSGKGKGKGVDRSPDYDPSMRKKGW